MADIARKTKRIARPSDGIFRQNVVLMSGLVAGPVAAGATSFENALVLSIGFSMITLITILLCRFVPRKISYAIRIVIYAVVASVIYISVSIILKKVFSATALLNVGIYLPVLITNPVIQSKTETRLYLRSYGVMIFEVLGYVAGFVMSCLLVGIIRDILINSAVGWLSVDIGFDIPALETTFGGFIMLGILAGLFRAVYKKNRSKNTAVKTAEQGEAT